MARPLRLEFPGAIYHLTSRGNRREAIYEDDNDRMQWLEILSRACDRYNWRIHAYCLMDNHYHLLLETIQGNLSRGMRHLNGVYTQYFNRQHNRVGHVFQGRFKAILVEKESYLLELSRYIVLNPVRAHMVKAMDQWQWSSYLSTSGQVQKQDWLETDWLLSQFGKQRKRATEKYIDFVREGIGLPSIWKNLSNPVFLGDEAFVDQYQKMVLEKTELDEVPALQKRASLKPISHFQTKYEDTNIAIKEAYLTGGHTMKEIGQHFGKHYTTISRIIKRYE
jgi:putative transposase